MQLNHRRLCDRPRVNWKVILKGHEDTAAVHLTLSIMLFCQPTLVWTDGKRKFTIIVEELGILEYAMRQTREYFIIIIFIIILILLCNMYSFERARNIKRISCRYQTTKTNNNKRLIVYFRKHNFHIRTYGHDRHFKSLKFTSPHRW